VCLPHGIVYGRVPAADGPRIADAYLAGQLEPDWLRGRSAWPQPAQVAEQAVRLSFGLRGLHDVRLLDAVVDEASASVTLSAAGGTHRFELVPERGEPRAISCRADELERPLHWRVVSSRGA
jgi:hypothetical protein